MSRMTLDERNTNKVKVEADQPLGWSAFFAVDPGAGAIARERAVTMVGKEKQPMCLFTF